MLHPNHLSYYADDQSAEKLTFVPNYLVAVPLPFRSPVIHSSFMRVCVECPTFNAHTNVQLSVLKILISNVQLSNAKLTYLYFHII